MDHLHLSLVKLYIQEEAVQEPQQCPAEQPWKQCQLEVQQGQPRTTPKGCSELL